MTRSTVNRRGNGMEYRNEVAPETFSALSQEQILARANIDYQHLMVRQFKAIRESASMSTSELADLLEAPESMITAIENFEYDLSLTEVRHLAIALNAIVEVRVHMATAEEYAKTASRHLAEVLDMNNLWKRPRRAALDAESAEELVSSHWFTMVASRNY